MAEKLRKSTDCQRTTFCEGVKTGSFFEKWAYMGSKRRKLLDNKIAMAIFRAIGTPIPRCVIILEPEPEAAQT